MDEDKPLIDFNDAEKIFGQPSHQENPEPQIQSAPQILNTQPTLNDQQIPDEEAPRTSNKLAKAKNIAFWVVIVIVSFITGFLIVNGPAFAQKVYYWYSSALHKSLGNNNVVNPEVIVNNSISKSTNEQIPDNQLIIPSIGVDAPITWSIDDAQVQDKLLSGLVHYKSSSLPGVGGGNVFITGHSSNYWWIKSDYNHVFALLPNIQSGDKVTLTYNKIKYVYEVYDKFVVKPTQMEVINPINNQTTLTLMSCVPLGTNLNRLIVRTRLLYSDNGNNIKIQSVNSPTPLSASN